MRLRAVLPLVALTLIGCQRSEPKPLMERMYDKMVQRCRALMSKDDAERCSGHCT
jgi:hypothetical protein